MAHRRRPSLYKLHFSTNQVRANLLPLALFLQFFVSPAGAEAQTIPVMIPIGPPAPGQTVCTRAVDPPVSVPFGLVVPGSNSIYVEDAMGGISELELDSGVSRWQSKDYSTPLALVNNQLFVTKSVTAGNATVNKIIALNVNDDHKVVLESQPLPLPPNLTLPCDDYDKRIEWRTTAESGIMTVLWHLTSSSNAKAPLKQLFHITVEPTEEYGAFNVNLLSGAVQTIVFDKTLWQNLTAIHEKQIKPASNRLTSALEPEAVQYAAIGDMLIYVMKSFPTQPTIGSAGVVIKRQLKARSEKSDRPVWEHDLPAIFVPAMRSF